MKAIILGGGKGTRLKSFISDIPKPMAPVADRPFLEYLILQLKRWAIHDIVLSVGYKKEGIMSYFSTGSRWDVNITYLEEEIPLGTGGAIREAVKNINEPDIIVMNGDSFFNADFKELINFHYVKDSITTLALQKRNDASRCGRVIIDEQG